MNPIRNEIGGGTAPVNTEVIADSNETEIKDPNQEAIDNTNENMQNPGEKALFQPPYSPADGNRVAALGMEAGRNQSQE